MVKRRASNASGAAVNEPGWAKGILSSINWDFSTPLSTGRSGVRLFDCRKYHWFPATFVPEIPYTLIEVLSKPGARVLDPFAGIGTTVFQTLLLGRVPYATETCRVAVEFIRSLCILLNPGIDVSGILRDWEKVRAEYNPRRRYDRVHGRSPIRVEALRPWFAKGTFNQIMYFALSERGRRKPGMKAAMRISLSAALKALSAQDRGSGCIADNMLPKPSQYAKERNAFDRLDRNMRTLVKDVTEARRSLPPWAKEFLTSAKLDEHIVQEDAREYSTLHDGTIDLVVTSPPYPNMTDYATSQRLSYYWMGREPSEDLAREIGARRRRFKSTSVEQYRADMEKALDVVSRKVKLGGYISLVMPVFDHDREKNSDRKQAIQECLALMPRRGFVLDIELERILPPGRRHHNQAWTHLERESIHVYRKVSWSTKV